MPADRSEADTRAELIDPALAAAGWGENGSLVRREMLAAGRILPGGRREKPTFADYVLIQRGRKLAVVEAKKESAYVTAGLAQAKRDAGRLGARFAYSTNGRELYRADLHAGGEGACPAMAFPTPEELYDEAFGALAATARYWRERFAAVPWNRAGGKWAPRYYQQRAVTETLDALAAGRDRLLLTLATGTGKTAIAFQIAWALHQAKWNLTDWRTDGPPDDEPDRRPRVLFLADRNILANQACGAFNAFGDDTTCRITPKLIRSRGGGVPKNAAVFFTIFQTFTAGTGDDAEKPADGSAELAPAEPYYTQYAPDFFDLIVIDECHRGGANDESSWRGILEYFAPAVQLGLTATPKRDVNGDTYDYFGEPVYAYALKEGIADGFLSPFKVYVTKTELDEYRHDPADEVEAGDIDPDRIYREPDFNRAIVLDARWRKRCDLFLERTGAGEKAIVFCANQEHALKVRDYLNAHPRATGPDYCCRVTADDGAVGEAHLKAFQDNDLSVPTVLTTSHKLSTGVDAKDVRHVVLLRRPNNMVEFKQIVGRGTREFVDGGKWSFAIHDFVGASDLFADPEWDGPPAEPARPESRPATPPTADPRGDDPDGDDPERPERIVVRLADGRERTVQHMTTTQFINPSTGRVVSAADYLKALYEALPDLFDDEDKLRSLWGKPATRRKLMTGLAEAGFPRHKLEELRSLVRADGCDLYDVLAYVAFASPPQTRSDRVAVHRDDILARYEEPAQRAFLEAVLIRYADRGVAELDDDRLPDLIELRYGDFQKAVAELGDPGTIRSLFTGFQPYLYERAVAV